MFAKIAMFGGPAKIAHRSLSVVEESKPILQSPYTDMNFQEKQIAFADFLATHGRSYASLDEHSSRFDVFSSNYDMINAHNARTDATFEMAINHLADLTQEEVERRYLSAKLEVPKNLKKTRPHMLSASQLPDEVNWFEAGKVSQSVDQGGCGACWAFTTASTMEALYSITNNVDAPTYSVQYLLDCDDTNFGCDGGWMTDAYEWTAKNGIVSWIAYDASYMGRKQTCKRPNKRINRFYNTGANEEDMVSNERMKELLAVQPVGAATYSNLGCMNFYKSGILTEEDCKCSNPDKHEVNHAVTVVGYGISDRKGCSDYWLIKNSWGAQWGDQGLYKICADRVGQAEEFGTCQINSYVMWPSM